MRGHVLPLIINFSRNKTNFIDKFVIFFMVKKGKVGSSVFG